MNIDFVEEYEKLQLLLDQGQFELIFPSEDAPSDIRLVYLMNDAVESFLVFQNARLTGEYVPDYEGDLEATLEQISVTQTLDIVGNSGSVLEKMNEKHVPDAGFKSEKALKQINEKHASDTAVKQEASSPPIFGEYALIVHQGDTVCTLFFQKLVLETYLFNYGNTGHFWVKDYEYLRQLEYRIAVLRDKRVYLGEKYCSSEEIELSYLAEFPPLNFCCYPAVPDKYLVPGYPWWQVSEEAWTKMYALADEAGDQGMKKWLKVYARFPKKMIARYIARMLHTQKHAAVVDLLTQKLTDAAAIYEDRVFSVEEEIRFGKIKEKAEKRKNELEHSGKCVEMLKEEPFLYAKDSIEYKIHLMIWNKDGKNRKVEVETYSEKE